MRFPSVADYMAEAIRMEMYIPSSPRASITTRYKAYEVVHQVITAFDGANRNSEFFRIEARTAQPGRYDYVDVSFIPDPEDPEELGEIMVLSSVPACRAARLTW